MSLVRFRLGRLFPIVSLVTLSAVAGCASSTVLQTQPPGARVSINGVPMGTTPYTMTDTNIVTTTTHLLFEYPGYQPLDTMISARRGGRPVLPVLGFFLFVPLFWVMKYHPAHFFVLQPANGAPPAPNGWAPPQGYPPPAAGPAGYPAPPPGYPPPAPPENPPPRSRVTPRRNSIGYPRRAPHSRASREDAAARPQQPRYPPPQ